MQLLLLIDRPGSLKTTQGRRCKFGENGSKYSIGTEEQEQTYWNIKGKLQIDQTNCAGKGLRRTLHKSKAARGKGEVTGGEEGDAKMSRGSQLGVMHADAV